MVGSHLAKKTLVVTSVITWEARGQDQVSQHQTPTRCGIPPGTQSSDVVNMIDATSGLDRCDSKIFWIVMPSPGGAMPLETLFVSSEWQDILVKAFEMYKSLLPSYAFHGRGRNGPVCFLTDNCQAEYESFIQVFPSSEHLLCQFHLLQTIWRWIRAAAHKIEKKIKGKIKVFVSSRNCWRVFSNNFALFYTIKVKSFIRLD